MTQDQAKFESFLWQIQLYQLETTYKVINAFLLDERVRKVYLEEKYKTTSTISDILDKIENENQFLPDGTQIFRRQMVVLIRSYLEQICRDFYKNLSLANNNKYNSSLSLQKVISEIERLSGVIIPQDIQVGLCQLTNIRNIIAHEIMTEQVNDSFILDSIALVNSFIESLKKVCSQKNILDVDNWEEYSQTPIA